MASDLVLHYLHMPDKKDTRLIWVKVQTGESMQHCRIINKIISKYIDDVFFSFWGCYVGPIWATPYMIAHMGPIHACLLGCPAG